MSLINEALKKANQAQKKRAPQGPLGAPLQPVESLRRPPSHVPTIAAGLLAVVLAGASAWFFMGGKANDKPDLAQAGTSGSPITAAAAAPDTAKPTAENPSAPATVESLSNAAGEMESPLAPASPSATRAQIDTGATKIATESTPQPGVQRGDMAALRMPAPLTTPMTDASGGGTGESIISQPSATPEISTPSGARPAAPPSALPRPAATPKFTDPRTPGGAAAAGSMASADSAGSPGTAAVKGEIEFPNLQLQGIFFRLKNPSVMINRRSLLVGDKIAGVRIADIQRRTVTIEKDGQRKVLSMSGY